GDRLNEIEGKRSSRSNGAEVFAFVACADALAGVFEKDQIVFFADCLQCIEIGHASAHVYGHDAFCSGSACGFHGSRIKRERFIHIHEYRHCANAKNGFKTYNECEGGHDELIAGANTQRSHRGCEGRCTARGELCVLASEGIADLLFQFLRLPDSFTRTIESITHQYSGFQNIVHFLSLFITPKLKSWHIKYFNDYNFSYSARSFSRVIIFSQSLPRAFSQRGFMPIATLIIVSNCSSLRPLQMPVGISTLFFSTMRLNSFTPSG